MFGKLVAKVEAGQLKMMRKAFVKQCLDEEQKELYASGEYPIEVKRFRFKKGFMSDYAIDIFINNDKPIGANCSCDLANNFVKCEHLDLFVNGKMENLKSNNQDELDYVLGIINDDFRINYNSWNQENRDIGESSVVINEMVNPIVKDDVADEKIIHSSERVEVSISTSIEDENISINPKNRNMPDSVFKDLMPKDLFQYYIDGGIEIKKLKFEMSDDEGAEYKVSVYIAEGMYLLSECDGDTVINDPILSTLARDDKYLLSDNKNDFKILSEQFGLLTHFRTDYNDYKREPYNEFDEREVERLKEQAEEAYESMIEKIKARTLTTIQELELLKIEKQYYKEHLREDKKVSFTEKLVNNGLKATAKLFAKERLTPEWYNKFKKDEYPIEVARFNVKASGFGSYNVDVFMTEDGPLDAYCNCKGGKDGYLCKHMYAVFAADKDMIKSDNYPMMITLRKFTTDHFKECYKEFKNSPTYDDGLYYRKELRKELKQILQFR